MKAIAKYEGSDSYGRKVELAKSIAGNYFVRFYVMGNYGYQWSKWRQHMDPVVHPIRVLNKCEYYGAPEYIDVPEADRHLLIDWGFNLLRFASDGKCLRLPG